MVLDAVFRIDVIMQASHGKMMAMACASIEREFKGF
jgi:hypothetical protein